MDNTELPFDLLQQLPRDTLDRILFEYCDGKSLSTLAISCTTSSSVHYRHTLLARISTTCRRLFHQLCQDVQRDITGTLTQKKYSGMIQNSSSAGCFSWLVQWIQAVDSGIGCDINLQSMKQCLSAMTGTESENCIIQHSTHGRSMRQLSEDLAAIDFLRRRGMNSHTLQTVDVQWDEWPVFVGPITVQYPVDSASALVSHRANIQILTCGYPFDRSFPLQDLGTSFPDFRGEPANFLPCHPWGKVVGLSQEDDDILRKFAVHLDATDQVALPGRAGGIKIFSMHQAYRRYQLAPAFMRRKCHARMLHPRFAGSVVGGRTNEMEADSLVCCWDRSESDMDRSGLTNPRQDIDRMIHVMKHMVGVVPESI